MGFRAFSMFVLLVSLIMSLIVLLWFLIHLFMACLVGSICWLYVSSISFAMCSSMFPFGVSPVSVRYSVMVLGPLVHVISYMFSVMFLSCFIWKP